MVITNVAVAAFFLFAFGSFVMAENTPHPLFEFNGADAAKDWQAVNDGVMGGVSEGMFTITDRKTLEFSGTLSLENNGGFASVRTKAKKLGLEKGDTVVARVRGDGREYTLNLYLNKPLMAFSLSGDGSDQEGRVDRGQSPAGQVRGDLVRQAGERCRCGEAGRGQRLGLHVE